MFIIIIIFNGKKKDTDWGSRKPERKKNNIQKKAPWTSKKSNVAFNNMQLYGQA